MQLMKAPVLEYYDSTNSVLMLHRKELSIFTTHVLMMTTRNLLLIPHTHTGHGRNETFTAE